MAAQFEPTNLHPGRAVSLLPRAGGHAWPGLLTDWRADGGDHAVAQVRTDTAAADALDHHQVWLSTVGPAGSEEPGLTIFAGRALAQPDGSLLVDGVVRLVSEHRRSAVRATGARVVVDEQAYPAADVSRTGVRVAVDEEDWPHDDGTVVRVELGDGGTVTAAASLLRSDEDGTVLGLADVDPADAARVDRYALSQVEDEEGTDT